MRTGRRTTAGQARAHWLVVALLLLWGLGVARAADVPPSDPVYEFLRRAEAQGLLPEPLSASRPWSRADVGHWLERVAEQAQRLNAVERAQLAALRYRFTNAAAGGYAPAWRPLSEAAVPRRIGIYHNARDLWSGVGEEWELRFNPVLLSGTEWLDDGQRAALQHWATGFEFTGRVRAFDVLLRTTDAHVRGELELADSTDYPYRYGPGGAGFDFDEAEATIGWRTRHLAALFGKTRNAWGWTDAPGLLLSELPTSYTQLRLTAAVGPLQLTSLQAKLHQSPAVLAGVDTVGGAVRRHVAEKYLAAHRLEVRFHPRLQLGLYEAVVYGERGIDADYLVPLIFLRSAEHYAGDRDNALMGADFRWRAPGRVILSGELLLDDVTTTRLGTGWYGNKLGYQGGARAYDPLGLANTRVRLEYTRLEPYVYSHKFPINNLQHYGAALGAAIGPNSERWAAAVAWTVARALTLEARGERLRHGANPVSGRNVGGDFRRPWQYGDSEHVRFLDGDREERWTAGLNAKMEIVYDLHLEFDVSRWFERLRPESGTQLARDGWTLTAGASWHPW